MEIVELTKKEKMAIYARKYYHKRVAEDPNFVKYTNDRVKTLAMKKRHEEIGPKKKIGRPKKEVGDVVTEKKPRGRPRIYFD